jgi:hypothetical protein
MFEGICEAIHREMDQLEEKYASGKSAINSQDLKDIDTMAHALKSLATYEAMKGYSEYDGGSYARGRSRMTGRYVSRDSRDGGSGYSRSYYPEVPNGYDR